MANRKLTAAIALATTALAVGASEADAGSTRQFGGLWMGFSAGYAGTSASGSGPSDACLTTNRSSGEATGSAICETRAGRLYVAAQTATPYGDGLIFGSSEAYAGKDAPYSGSLSFGGISDFGYGYAMSVGQPPNSDKITTATSGRVGSGGATAAAGSSGSTNTSSQTETSSPVGTDAPGSASAASIAVSGDGLYASAAHGSVFNGSSSGESLAIGFGGLSDGDVSGSDGGVAAGIHLRYDHQTESNWLFGAELSITSPGGSGASGSDTSTFGLRTEDYTSPDLKINRAVSVDTTALASARLRLGYAMGDYLAYATGGLAYARYNATSTTTGSFDGVQASETATANGDAVGGVIGGGVSSFVADNATISVEGLYYRFGGDDVHFDNGASAGLDSAFSVMTTFSIRAN